MSIAMKFPLRRAANTIYDAFSRHVGRIEGVDFTGAQDEAHAAFLVSAANAADANKALTDLCDDVEAWLSDHDNSLGPDVDRLRVALAAAKGQTR